MKKITAAIYFAIVAFLCNAQSIDHSQPFTNLLYTNPAFTGTNVCPRIYLNHRTKNYSYDRAFQSYIASYDQSIRTWNLDLGGLIFRDDNKMSSFSTTGLLPIVSKSIKISKKGILKAALQVDILHQGLETNEFTYPDQIDYRYGYIYPTGETDNSYSKWSAGFSGGVLYYTSKLFAGIALHNITQPKTENSKKYYHLPRRLSAHIGYDINIATGIFYRQNISIKPALYYQQESRYSLIQPGITAQYRMIILGIYGRISSLNSVDSFTPVIGFNQKRFKFAYTCDVHVVGHKKNELDTHEVSLTFYMPCGKYSPKQKSIECPNH